MMSLSPTQRPKTVVETNRDSPLGRIKKLSNLVEEESKKLTLLIQQNRKVLEQNDGLASFMSDYVVEQMEIQIGHATHDLSLRILDRIADQKGIPRRVMIETLPSNEIDGLVDEFCNRVRVGLGKELRSRVEVRDDIAHYPQLHAIKNVFVKYQNEDICEDLLQLCNRLHV